MDEPIIIVAKNYKEVNAMKKIYAKSRVFTDDITLHYKDKVYDIKKGDRDSILNDAIKARNMITGINATLGIKKYSKYSSIKQHTMKSIHELALFKRNVKSAISQNVLGDHLISVGRYSQYSFRLDPNLTVEGVDKLGQELSYYMIDKPWKDITIVVTYADDPLSAVLEYVKKTY